MVETGEVSVGGILGDKLYQARARKALPILVRQAKAWHPIVYGQLAHELGMPNPRNLNYVLGAIGNSLLELGRIWNSRVPAIQALVINKQTELPGEGLSWFVPDAAEFLRAPLSQRRQIVDAMLGEIYLYKRWDAVLKHFGMKPLPAPAETLPPVETVAGFGRGGEGEAHRRLKERIASDPTLVGLEPSFATRDTEVPLYSGDRLDVQFKYRRRRVAIEVKPASAPLGDLIRGIFQCVKYLAVMEAEERMRNSDVQCSVMLALGEAFPETLASLRSTLGINVVDALDSEV